MQIQRIGNIANRIPQSKTINSHEQSIYMTQVKLNSMGDSVSFEKKADDINLFLKTFSHIFGDIKVSPNVRNYYSTKMLPYKKVEEMIEGYNNERVADYTAILEKKNQTGKILADLKDHMKKYSFSVFESPQCDSKFENEIHFRLTNDYCHSLLANRGCDRDIPVLQKTTNKELYNSLFGFKNEMNFTPRLFKDNQGKINIITLESAPEDSASFIINTHPFNNKLL